MIGEDIIYEYPHADRLIIIEDIHGDIKRFKNILIDAKIINNNIEWIANPQNTVVIQMGDQIDSLNRDIGVAAAADPASDPADWEKLEDIEMIYFTNLLDKLAQSKGGRFISVIGNHEFMNVIGNYSYVSKKSIMNGTERRNELFKPGGKLAGILSHRPIIVKIGKLLFCHAGLKSIHLAILKKFHKDISHINKVWKRFVMCKKVFREDKKIFDRILLDYDGILWTRDLDSQEETNAMLKELGCIYMFVGHTVVDGIKFINDTVWYTDTGISRAFGNNVIQYIEILNYHIYVRTVENDMI
jgi:hypothetical protein